MDRMDNISLWCYIYDCHSENAYFYILNSTLILLFIVLKRLFMFKRGDTFYKRFKFIPNPFPYRCTIATLSLGILPNKPFLSPQTQPKKTQCSLSCHWYLTTKINSINFFSQHTTNTCSNNTKHSAPANQQPASLRHQSHAHLCPITSQLRHDASSRRRFHPYIMCARTRLRAIYTRPVELGRV